MQGIIVSNCRGKLEPLVPNTGYFPMSLEFGSLLPNHSTSGLGSGTGTCCFWVGVGALILIFIGLKIIHVDLGSQGGEEGESS